MIFAVIKLLNNSGNIVATDKNTTRLFLLDGKQTNIKNVCGRIPCDLSSAFSINGTASSMKKNCYKDPLTCWLMKSPVIN